MILNKSSVERGLHYGQVYKVRILSSHICCIFKRQEILEAFFYGTDN